MTKQLEHPRYVLFSAGLAPEAEAVRWLLEARSIAYADQSGGATAHRQVAKQYGAEAAAPLLVGPAGASAGLFAILQHLDDLSRSGEKVLGETQTERAAITALITVILDKLLWPAQQVFHYFVPDFRPARAPDTAPGWQVPFAETADRWRQSALDTAVRPDDFDLETALASIDAAFDAVEAQKGTKRFLGGATPNSADIVFAALCTPVIIADQTTLQLPGMADLPNNYREITDRYRLRPGGALALEAYATARPNPQPPMAHISKGPSLALRLIRLPLALWLARQLVALRPTLTFRGSVFALSWQSATEVLTRDTDFIIEPVNKTRIEAVSGPFILGMDRAAPDLFKQREAIYAAQAALDLGPVWQTLSIEADALMSAARNRQGRIDIVSGYARRVAARTAAQIFGVRGPNEAQLMRVLRAVFHETFLNLGDDPQVRKTGIAAGQELGEWIDAEITARGDTPGTDVLGGLLRAQAKLSLPPGSARWMLAGLMVGAVDTTATAVSNITEVILRNQTWAAAIREDLDNPARMRQWCYEALRLRPHNPIILRKAAHASTLGAERVAPGSSVIAVTIAAMQDSAVFPSPGQLRPGREMNRYLHFGYGLHACAGRDFNAHQIPALVAHLLRNGADKVEKVRFRGPFPDEVIVRLGDN